MRSSSLFLMSLIFVSSCSFSAHAIARGFEKDSRGRTLVYRAQPSWWSIPGGVVLGGIGKYVVEDAYYGSNKYEIKANASGRLSDIPFVSFFEDTFLYRFLANVSWKFPINLKGKPARVVEGAFGAAVAASGAGLLYVWAYNYARLNTPLIIIDQVGLHYEGKDTINWKDVRSVNLVHGSTKKGHALEIVDLYDRYMIYESDLAITIDTLYDLIMQHFSGVGKYIEKIKGIFNNVCKN